MINNVNTNPAILWPNAAKPANNKKAANPEFPINSSVSEQMPLFAALGMNVPGGGRMTASVFKADGFTAHNPVMLVKGKDVCGTPFEAEVNINNVNPRNASFIEMFALDGYLAANGKPHGVTRAAAAVMAVQEALAENAGNTAFTKFDFVTPLLEHLETQRFHRNWEAVAWLSPIVDSLLSHI